MQKRRSEGARRRSLYQVRVGTNFLKYFLILKIGRDRPHFPPFPGWFCQVLQLRAARKCGVKCTKKLYLKVKGSSFFLFAKSSNSTLPLREECKNQPFWYRKAPLPVTPWNM